MWCIKRSEQGVWVVRSWCILSNGDLVLMGGDLGRAAADAGARAGLRVKGDGVYRSWCG